MAVNSLLFLRGGAGGFFFGGVLYTENQIKWDFCTPCKILFSLNTLGNTAPKRYRKQQIADPGKIKAGATQTQGECKATEGKICVPQIIQWEKDFTLHAKILIFLRILLGNTTPWDAQKQSQRIKIKKSLPCDPSSTQQLGVPWNPWYKPGRDW